MPETRAEKALARAWRKESQRIADDFSRERINAFREARRTRRESSGDLSALRQFIQNNPDPDLWTTAQMRALLRGLILYVLADED